MKESNIEHRLEICHNCPIYSPQNGGKCNSNLYLNPDTNDVSTTQRPGYIRGCGCFISVKIRNINNHCNAGKW